MLASATRALVTVSPPQALAARPRLFAALQAAFPVRFAGAGEADGEPGTAAGAIVVGTSGPCPQPGVPTITFTGGGVAAVAASPAPFRLTERLGVDRRVRGTSLTERALAPPITLRGEVLAECAQGAAWTVRRDPAETHRVAAALPELGPGDVLYAMLSHHQLTAVALVQFLRRVTRGRAAAPPPLRAAFVFDDPNLRGRGYGHIDYAALLRHAEAHGYHAAMAMIPLDARGAHRVTGELFRHRRDRLSLLVHGNDHTRGELLAPVDDAGARAVAAQALHRIGRFERRTGVRVDRVMAPPHGLCSPAMTRALAAVGFDALTAIHPRPWTEARPEGPLLAGWRPADFVGGCAVIPRVPLSSARADLALRAFLDHPLIVYGHHEDLAGGLDALGEAAAIINSFGNVEWSPVGEIAAGNFAAYRSGGQLHVTPFSRRLRVPSTPGVTSLVVTAPDDALADSALTGVELRAGDGPGQRHAFGSPIPLGADPLEIRVTGAADTDPSAIAAPAWTPWPKLRRAVTEARDRSSSRRRAPLAATGSRSA